MEMAFLKAKWNQLVSAEKWSVTGAELVISNTAYVMPFLRLGTLSEYQVVPMFSEGGKQYV